MSGVGPGRWIFWHDCAEGFYLPVQAIVHVGKCFALTSRSTHILFRQAVPHYSFEGTVWGSRTTVDTVQCAARQGNETVHCDDALRFYFGLRWLHYLSHYCEHMEVFQGVKCLNQWCWRMFVFLLKLWVMSVFFCMCPTRLLFCQHVPQRSCEGTLW